MAQAGDDENWQELRAAVRLVTADGGILDPDDSVLDVVDDREQVNACCCCYKSSSFSTQAYFS